MPATDIAGLALSALSFTIQLGQLGGRISEKFQRAKADDNELWELSLAILHESEQSNILSSVLCEEGKFGIVGSIFGSVDPKNQKILLGILEQLWGIWQETNDFANAIFQGAIPLPSQTTPAQLESQEQLGLGAFRRSAELERLKRLLRTATNWNTRLERRIQSYSWLCSAEGASAAQSIKALNKIAEDSHARKLGWNKPAQLRQLALGLDNPDVSRATLPIPQSLRMQAVVTGLGTLHNGILSGTMGRRKVLVEFLPVFQVPDGTSEEAMAARVEELVAFLSLEKEAAFRIPPPKGFYYDRRHGQFGIVFDYANLGQPRQAEVVTLHKAFEEAEKGSSKGERILDRPSLDSRFRLAHALALGVSKLQSVGWVHQGIRSENIAFLSRTPLRSHISYADPWYFGYGSSRTDSAVSVPLFDDNPIHNIYRHPERWDPKPTRFTKLHDIYSLGVVLLEIAVWKPVKTLVKQSLMVCGASPREVQKELMSLSRNIKVAELMGVQFAGIIEKCLEAESNTFGVDADNDDKEDTQLQLAFQEMVVEALKKVVDAL